ncbi:MAG: hypothetical protein U0802_08895 [Candidatus Binatia bacterium]
MRQQSGKIVHAFHATVAPESLAGIDDRGCCTGHDAENDVCRFYPLAGAAADDRRAAGISGPAGRTGARGVAG